MELWERSSSRKKDPASEVLAHIKVLDKFAVVGFDTEMVMTITIQFLQEHSSVIFNFNKSKKLLWLVGFISDDMAVQFAKVNAIE